MSRLLDPEDMRAFGLRMGLSERVVEEDILRQRFWGSRKGSSEIILNRGRKTIGTG